jgi:hypothetical protein
MLKVLEALSASSGSRVLKGLCLLTRRLNQAEDLLVSLPCAFGIVTEHPFLRSDALEA